MRSPWDIITGDRERDSRNVAVLLESVTDLYSPRLLEDVTRHALDRAVEVTGAQRGILLLNAGEGDEGALQAVLARSANGTDLPLDLRYSRSVVDRVWKTQTPHQTVDAEDRGVSLGQSIVDLRLLSIMATPLTVKDEKLGVLYVDSTRQAKEFSDADFSVFRALGGLVAVAVENGRLLEQQAERQRLERELAVARQIQQRLRPTDLPRLQGLDIAAHGRAAEETSGDYYDVIPLPDGRIVVVVGDVSGHGLGPALFMVSTRALIHSLIVAEPSPRRVLERLNAFLERDMADHSFMSLFLGILDPSDRTLRYASAGHNPPIVVRSDGSVEELVRTGPVLGILGDATFEEAGPVRLEDGDVLTLYTDGIFEAHDEKNDMYGEERFRGSLVELCAGPNRADSAESLLRDVLARLFDFVGDRPLDDDVTAVVLRAVERQP